MCVRKEAQGYFRPRYMIRQFGWKSVAHDTFSPLTRNHPIHTALCVGYEIEYVLVCLRDDLER